MRTNLILLVAATVLALVLAEGLLQVRYRLREGEWLPLAADEFRVGYAAPVADRREYALKPGYTGGGVTIDATGFRRGAVAPGYRGRLVCALGDSVPFGYGVGDDQSYPAQLEGLLRAGGAGARVLNAGVPSYTLWQSLDRLFLDVLPAYQPDLVTLHAANDMSLVTHYGAAWRPELTWASMRMSSPLASLGAARKLATVRLMHKLGVATARPPGESHRAHSPAALLGFLEAELARRVGFFERYDVPLILLPIELFAYADDPGYTRSADLSLWPRWRGHLGVFAGVAAAVNGVLREFASRHPKVHFFETGPRFDRRGREGMFIDIIHLSPAGGGFLAGELAAFIRERGLLPPPAGAPAAPGMGFLALLERGLARGNAGDLEAAIADYRRALAAQPDHPQAATVWNNLGWSLGTRGRFDEGIAALEHALRLKPGFPLATNNLAWARRARAEADAKAPAAAPPGP